MDSIEKTGILLKLTKNVLNKIPHEPGVYLYLDVFKKVLYVGKAKDLHARISSYFVESNPLPKTKALLKQAKFIKIIPTVSELDAFLLEAELIKLFKPKYNIQLKDDKSYPYIALQKVCIEDGVCYYKMFLTRNLNLKDTSYFGPYPDVGQVRRALKIIRRIFPIPRCSKTKFLEHRKRGRPCLYGQIGVCPAPCVNKVAFKQVKLNAKRIKNLFNLRHSGYISRLQGEMQAYAKAEEFEKAIKIRDTLALLEKLKSHGLLQSDYSQNPYLTQDIYKERIRNIKQVFGGYDALKYKEKLVDYVCKESGQNGASNSTRTAINSNNSSLSEQFNNTRHEAEGLPDAFRIEAYDMSTLMLQNSTASMVVSLNGQISKSLFRRFKIRKAEGLSDFDMFKEVFWRRIKHCDWQFPDLILLDGGRQQVSSVLKVLLFLAGFLEESGENTPSNTTNVQKILTTGNLIGLRKIRLNNDIFERLAIEKASVLDVLNELTLENAKTRQAKDHKVKLLAKIFLFFIPIWGIYKPFDNFVTFKPHIKLVLGEYYSIYVRQLKDRTDIAVQEKNNWLFILPKQRNLGIRHLQDLRDNAHDFAKRYHVKLRDVI